VASFCGAGLLWGIALVLASVASAAAQTVTQNGTEISLKIAHADSIRTASDPVREFENVVVQVRLADAVTKSPITGGSPAAWIDRRPDGVPLTAGQQCVGKVQRFAEGSTFSRTALDLTSYFVVIMNADATLTVVDPRFGYGDTRLLAMVKLDAPAEDWALTADGRRLFVSVPDANEVVSVDAEEWRITATNASIAHAAVVAMQPDEAYVWAAYEDGVYALVPGTLKVAARIPTGRGDHHLAFTADSSTLFVTNPDDGTVSVVDIRKLAKSVDLKVGGKPVWIAYSDLAKAAYVANEATGEIAAIDAAIFTIRATMKASPGLGQIRFAPGGRFLLAVNPTDDMLYVADAASDRIVQHGKLDKGPDQIAFTNKTAHIRHRGSDAVLMIALESLGAPDADISVADFTGGRHAPGAMSRSTPADGVVQASGENGVLVANPADKSIYLYMEGAAAPMGNFSNYGHEPRAILSVDRNLRERAPGVYETSTTLPAEGAYDLALFLDRPRIVACFDLQVAADPALARIKPPKLKIEPRVSSAAAVGEVAHLAFRLTLAETGKPAAEVKDAVILMAGAGWQRREVASYAGDGVYAVDFKLPAPGVYNVFLSSQSMGLTYQPYATVTVANRPN
jgi:hypothetical protein